MSEEYPEIKIVKSPDFKMIYANGTFGGLDSSEGTILFYIDRPIPKMKDGNIEVDYFERELQAEVHIPYELFLIFSDFMKRQIEYVKSEIEKEAS